MIDWDDVRYFLAVARAGSVRRSAFETTFGEIFPSLDGPGRALRRAGDDVDQGAVTVTEQRLGAFLDGQGQSLDQSRGGRDCRM